MGWLSGWNYRKEHVLTGSVGGGDQTDYQVGIKVYYTSGTDGTEVRGGATFGKVYVDSKSKTDFGDIRFTEDDGSTQLDYWIEEKTDSTSTVIWVEVDEILDSPATTSIYMYYGNSGVSTTSSGTNTFIVWNDCDDDTEWSVDLTVGSPAWGEATVDGCSTIYVEVNYHNEKIRIRYDTQSSTARENRRFIARIKHTSWNSDSYFQIYSNRRADVPLIGDMIYYMSYNDYYRVYSSYGGVSSYDTYNAGHPSGWYRYETLTNTSGKVTGYRGNTNIGDATQDGNESGGTVQIYVREYNPGLCVAYMDWFARGKYCDPEPTHTSWGSEQEPGWDGGVFGISSPAAVKGITDIAAVLGITG